MSMDIFLILDKFFDQIQHVGMPGGSFNTQIWKKKLKITLSFLRHSKELRLVSQVTGISLLLPFEYQYLYLVLHYISDCSQSKYCTEHRMFCELELPFANGFFFCIKSSL